MKEPEANYITLGKIGSTHGVRGWIKVQSYAELTDNIFDHKIWYLSSPQGQYRPITVEDWKPYGKGSLVKFVGIETPEEARLLTGKTINVPRSDLPELEKDEYYWTDLIGLTVINKQGEILGKVTHLMETGSNDVLIIKNTKEHAIPFLMDSVILSVDLEKKEIQVDWELI